VAADPLVSLGSSRRLTPRLDDCDGFFAADLERS
jgi:16S rRNA C967 or C1407 C5-methylase (RsmB/RsmF family)